MLRATLVPLAALALSLAVVPTASAAPDAQRHGGHHGGHVVGIALPGGGGTWGITRHWGRPWGWRPPVVVAPVLVPPPAPLVVPVPVSVPVPVPQYTPAYAPAVAPSCGCAAP